MPFVGGSFGAWEMILIFLVVLLLFGAKRLPEIGSSMGKGIREFKSSMQNIKGELSIPADNTIAQPSSESIEGQESRRRVATSEKEAVPIPSATTDN